MRVIARPHPLGRSLLGTLYRHFSSGTPNQAGARVSDTPMHSYLRQNLLGNKVQHLKPFQYEALMASRQGFNIFVNSCTGSGKTLSYLLPVLDTLLKDADKLDASKQRPAKHGAVILTLNKELCLQIYRTIRMLDPEEVLSTKRTGPISHYMPVVTELNNYDKAEKKTEEAASLIDSKINRNLVSTVKWSATDILISTPQLLYNIMTMTHSAKNLLCPKYIVVDEADLLLEVDRNVSRHTFKLIEMARDNEKALKLPTIQGYQPTKFVISASSFPARMNKKDSKQALQSIFRPLRSVAGVSQHQIPSNIDLYFLQTHKMPESKLYYLKDIISSRPHQRCIIFCNNKKCLDEILPMLRYQLKLQCEAYHASLDTNQRSRVLQRFDGGGCAVLLSTDLGSRGLDFTLPIEYIVEYEMADNITGFINRVGRTGRNGVKGEVITMVGPGNEEMFRHLQEIVASNDRLDELFSRKRSYRKLYKQ